MATDFAPAARVRIVEEGGHWHALWPVVLVLAIAAYFWGFSSTGRYVLAAVLPDLVRVVILRAAVARRERKGADLYAYGEQLYAHPRADPLHLAA